MPLELGILSLSSLIKISMSGLSITKSNDDCVLYQKLVLGGNGRLMLLHLVWKRMTQSDLLTFFLGDPDLLEPSLTRSSTCCLRACLAAWSLALLDFLECDFFSGQTTVQGLLAKRRVPGSRMQCYLEVIELIAAEGVRTNSELVQNGPDTVGQLML
jgi:hypothetical protein